MSQIVSWDVQHLADAAREWNATAEQWQDSFASVHHATLAPGGTVWEGKAADAAQERTYRDLVKVRGLADTQQEAGAIARREADYLEWARRRALLAVNEAETAGFAVEEDLSVTSRRRGGNLAAQAQRLALARQHAAMITGRAGELSTLDKEVAAKLTTATAALNEVAFPEAPAETDGKKPVVQAVDYKTAPSLDPPLHPPPNQPYPVNEVIAEATDLDGNRILLRRGYYDARTGKGFGWDKAYWRHGVVNPNVVKDLISHSRPVSNKDGVLVYEVPINRVHCTKGVFGIADCEDTGESLTMRIVANINEGRPEIPVGGQKGIISMYPLKGGIGVVEIKPDWTWTPPWVNNNVPIN